VGVNAPDGDRDLNREVIMKAMRSIGIARCCWPWSAHWDAGARHSKKEVFYLIASNQALPYWQAAAAGFNHAATEYQVTTKVEGPRTTIRRLNSANAEGRGCQAGGILVQVSDAAVLQPEIDAANRRGNPSADHRLGRRSQSTGSTVSAPTTLRADAGRPARCRKAGRQGQRRVLHIYRPAESR